MTDNKQIAELKKNNLGVSLSKNIKKSEGLNKWLVKYLLDKHDKMIMVSPNKRFLDYEYYTKGKWVQWMEAITPKGKKPEHNMINWSPIPTESDCMDILQEWCNIFKVASIRIVMEYVPESVGDGEIRVIAYDCEYFGFGKTKSRHLALVEALCWAWDQIKDKLLEAIND